MTNEQIALLSTAILVIGFLYSSVGHAGASGYIAVMSLFSLSPAFIKPTALLLNIFVATITTWQFYKAGHFSWRLFWPFAILAVPFAFLGGYVNLPTHYFKMLVGIILLYSAYRFLCAPHPIPSHQRQEHLSQLSRADVLAYYPALPGRAAEYFLRPFCSSNDGPTQNKPQPFLRFSSS
jgi:uncharacterized protein